MTLKLEAWHGVVAVLILVLFGLTRTSVAPYMNNHLKPHRWRSEVCKAEGIDVQVCAISLPQLAVQDQKEGRKILSSEVPMFDICMEHGEWRRIK